MAIDYTNITSSDQIQIDADLDFQSHKGINVSNGTAAQDLATKGQLDSAIAALSFLASSNFVLNEVLSVSTNSATLANTPLLGKQLIFKNGILLTPGVGKDYTISGAVVTFLNTFKGTDKGLACYIK